MTEQEHRELVQQLHRLKMRSRKSRMQKFPKTVPNSATTMLDILSRIRTKPLTIEASGNQQMNRGLLWWKRTVNQYWIKFNRSILPAEYGQFSDWCNENCSGYWRSHDDHYRDEKISSTFWFDNETDQTLFLTRFK